MGDPEGSDGVADRGDVDEERGMEEGGIGVGEDLLGG